MKSVEIIRGTAAIAVISMMFCGIVSARDGDTITAAELIRDFSLEQQDVPVSQLPGWRKPQRILVLFADADRMQWLAATAPEVEFIAAADFTEAQRVVAGVDAVLGYCSPELISAGVRLTWVQAYSAGVDRCMEGSLIKDRRILLTNMQRIYGPEISEHVMAMLFMFSRGLYRYYPRQLAGEWDNQAVPQEQMWELKGKTMLVVGLGGIGTEIARRAHALGMRVVATRNSSRSGPAFVDYVGLADELLELVPRADVVVNATPLTPATTDLFDAGFFQRMKSTAYFINIGRGRSVVTDDLLAALEGGHLAGAGLDVTEPEPLPPGHPLWKHPNVIITPHISGFSDLRSERFWVLVRENLRRYVKGEAMLNVVDPDKGY